MPAGSATPPLIAAAAAGLAAGLAAWGLYRVRGSTAVPAAAWSIVACLALAGEQSALAVGGLSDPATAAAVRLAVVAASLCPTMSLLGAKRPQHTTWQFIVATLAFVLVLPAISARLVRPGSQPDIHVIERCLMAGLVLVGWMNFAGTGRAVAATCVAIGQILLARGFLPGATADAMGPGGGLDAVAAVLIAAAAGLAAIQSLLGRRGAEYAARFLADGSLAAAIDPPFIALRETLGAAWTLRLAEGFDAVATARGWPCRLRFGGIEAADAEDGGGAAWHHDALHAFRALARRFVNDAWLARHGWPETVGRGRRSETGAES